MGETGSTFGKGSKALLVLAGAVVLVAGLRAAAALVVPILLAACVATATAPIVDWLHAHRIPTWAAVTLTMVGVLAVLSGFGFLLASGLGDLSASLPAVQSWLTHAQRGLAEMLTHERIHWLARAVSAFDPTEGIEALVAGAMAGAATYVSSFWIVILVAVFILLESATFRDKVIRATTSRTHGDEADREARAGHVGATVREVQKFMLVKTAVSAATGISVALLDLAVGLRHPELWGLLAFALNYIPTLGSAAAAIPPIVLAFVQLGIGPGLVTLIGYFVINTALGSVIEPRLLGRALGLSPLVVVLSVIFWGWVLGPIGALLSVPLTMIVKIVLSRTEDMRWVAVLLASGEPEVGEGPERPEREAEGPERVRPERRRRRRRARKRDEPAPPGAADHGARAASGG